MAKQQAIQDENQFPALLGHSGTAGTAETVRIVANQFGGLTTQTPAVPEVTLIDGTTTTDITYIGKADCGSNEGSAVWQIKRIDGTISNYTAIKWADGNVAYDNLWSGRGTISYS